MLQGQTLGWRGFGQQGGATQTRSEQQLVQIVFRHSTSASTNFHGRSHHVAYLLVQGSFQKKVNAKTIFAVVVITVVIVIGNESHHTNGTNGIHDKAIIIISIVVVVVVIIIIVTVSLLPLTTQMISPTLFQSFHGARKGAKVVGSFKLSKDALELRRIEPFMNLIGMPARVPLQWIHHDGPRMNPIGVPFESRIVHGAPRFGL
mmetsp:Transcript_10015/g.21896  ORF Transcript_10015/g.21896 Transcript_10015/m.21896 type:complete len:204 (+) Transcript_10015:409-1020(+)